LSLVHSETVQV